jgi:hypothetical protein
MDRARASHAFRQRLQRKYGQSDPTEAWKRWDEQRKLQAGKVAR